MTNPSAAKILIVTVIYNQKISDTNVYKTLLSEKEDVYIYDNSPSPQPIDNFPKNWVYIWDKSNPGLSVAYNKAAEYAASNGYDWLLISDQDTIYPQKTLERYRWHIGAFRTTKMFLPKVKISDSTYLSPVTNKFYFAKTSDKIPVSGEIELKKYAVINSGILVTTDSFLSCGGYNNKVFLDFSDFQFIERFENIYHSAMIIDIECLQDFSNIVDSTQKKLSRFILFCKSLSAYESNKRYGKFMIAIVTLKRALNLCRMTKNIKPLIIFFKTYGFHKN